MKKSTIIKRLHRCEADLQWVSSQTAELFDTLLTIAQMLNNQLEQTPQFHHQPDNTPGPFCPTPSGIPPCATQPSSDKKEISLYIQRGRFLLNTLFPRSQANPRQKTNALRLAERMRPLFPAMAEGLKGKNTDKHVPGTPLSPLMNPKERKDGRNHPDQNKEVCPPGTSDKI